MIRRVALLAVAFIILSLSVSALAAEPGKGTIEGQIVNGTKDGSSVAALEVTLRTRLNDAEVGSTTARTDSQGYFVFKELSTETSYRYQVSLNFQQVEYYSELLSFDEGKTSQSVKIDVYETTTSDEAISTAMMHTVIYIGQDVLTVKEVFLFVNDSDRTYVGLKEIDNKGNKETLQFYLPEAATGLQVSRGLIESLINRTQSGFVDSLPVIPGPTEVAYSYTIPYSSSVYKFSQKFNYSTDRYDLLFQGRDVKITSGQMVPETPLDIEGTTFSHFSDTDLARGEVIVAELSSLPGISHTTPQNTILWISSAFLALAAGIILFYRLRRKPLRIASVGTNTELRRNKLLVELSKLDDKFETGKIPEEPYHKQRAEIKAELIALIKNLEEK